MQIPLENNEQNIARNRKAMEDTPETWIIRFYEATTVAKQIAVIKPKENGYISKILANVGCMDGSLNGYIQLWISRMDLSGVLVPLMVEGENQVLWEMMSGAKFEHNDTDFNPNYPYITRDESLYIYLMSNIPAGTFVRGDILIYNKSTFA